MAEFYTDQENSGVPSDGVGGNKTHNDKESVEDEATIIWSTQMNTLRKLHKVSEFVELKCPETSITGQAIAHYGPCIASIFSKILLNLPKANELGIR